MRLGRGATRVVVVAVISEPYVLQDGCPLTLTLTLKLFDHVLNYAANRCES